jgi:hypothetical protein
MQRAVIPWLSLPALLGACLPGMATAQAPQVNAGPDQVVTTLRLPPPVVIPLDGTVSPAAATVVWDQVAGRQQPRFGNVQAANTTVSFIETGPFTLRLTATLGGNKVSDTMTVHVVVPPLPADNLVANPWFRDPTGKSGSMAGWTVAKGSWNATKKGHNPSPDILGQTAGDLDPRGGANQDTYIYQVVSANAAHRRLRFRMYWVTISMVQVYVKILGGPTKSGPWTTAWTPFLENKAHTVRWAQSALVQTTVKGHSFYRIELHGVLPANNGAAKFTGIYFTAATVGTEAASYVPFGTGCKGSAGIPKLRARTGNTPVLGQPLHLEMTGLPGKGGGVLLVVGFSDTIWQASTLPRELAFIGMPRCTLDCELFTYLTLLQSNGALSFSTPIPNAASLSGVVFYNQAVVADPAAGNALGATLSNAGRGIIGNY